MNKPLLVTLLVILAMMSPTPNQLNRKDNYVDYIVSLEHKGMNTAW